MSINITKNTRTIRTIFGALELCVEHIIASEQVVEELFLFLALLVDNLLKIKIEVEVKNMNNRTTLFIETRNEVKMMTKGTKHSRIYNLAHTL